MKELAKPVIDPDEPLDEVIARCASYGNALLKQQKRLIDLPYTQPSTVDRPKTLSNTGRDKALKQQKTVHDFLFEHPNLLQQFESDFIRKK